MIVRTLMIAGGVIACAMFPALAQTVPAEARSAINLPEACRAGAAGGSAEALRAMQSAMSQAMQSGMQSMPGQMTETQKGLGEAMRNMSPPMMTGMMAKDADVAWICTMIPHHQGAIDMARAGLKGADNEESRRLAQETIASQEKEIAKLVSWLDKNAATESKNEGSAPRR